MSTLRIATRKSPLALWQAEHVKSRLLQSHPDIRVELVPLSTKGDRILDVALAKIGGKGLFVKELENALFDGRADLAVHSMKDVPMELPTGLVLNTILRREDPTDALVSNHFADLGELPDGARVGTSSLRRQCQLLEYRPDLRLSELRGNVNTRLARLDAGEFDAIILASAGLKRLGLEARIRRCLAPEILLPAVGQGAIGIEIRESDTQTARLLDALHDSATAVCVLAERSLNRRLQGGCQVPIAAYAVQQTDACLWLRGLVGSTDGRQVLRVEGKARHSEAQQLGRELAEQLLEAGAEKVLAPLWGAQ